MAEKLAVQGEANEVYMSIETYEEQKGMLAHRASILAAEVFRLAGSPTFTQEDLDIQVEVLLSSYEREG